MSEAWTCAGCLTGYASYRRVCSMLDCVNEGTRVTHESINRHSMFEDEAPADEGRDDIPMCVCADYYDGHPADCPVRLFVERLETKGLKDALWKALLDLEKEKMLRLGGLQILVTDGIISSGRARELGGFTIEKQRAYVRRSTEGDEEDGFR